MEERSKPWDTGAEAEGEEMAARWCKENGMKDEDVRAVAEGRMVRWNEQVELEEGTIVQGYGKSPWRNGEEEEQEEEREEPLGIG